MNSMLGTAPVVTGPTANDTLLVACLCAQWCGTCKDYRTVFERLHAEFPGARFRWVDVEDEADVVDPIEVDNFPTLLIAQGEAPCFFGTVTPHADTLRRLVQSCAEASPGSSPQPQAVHDLLGRLLR